MAKINTVFSMTDEVTNPLKRIQIQLEKTSGGFNDMTMKMLSVNQAVQLISTAVNGFKKACSVMDELTATYNIQAEQEIKLATVMKQRMNATEADIQSIKDLASAQQELGIYGDELILNGAQEIATFVSSRKALETLVPAMNDLIAQQKGYNASIQDFQSVGDMMGKVMGGQVSALSRIGYVFSDAEKQMLQYGTEEERASVLAKIITDNVGHMNQALAGTDAGAIQNATNALGDMYERLGQNLMPLQNSFKQIKTSVMLYFEKPLMKAITWVKSNIGSLIATIINLGTIMTVVGTAMAIAWVVANWPLTLAIALAVTFTRALFDLTADANTTAEAMNGFGNQCAQAGNMFGMVVGFIAGTVGGLMNIIYNVIAVVNNALMYVSEFILNIFTHPINAIARLFLDLGNTIIQILSTLAGAVDWIFNTSMSKSLNEASRQIEAFKEKNFGNVDFKYQKMSLKDVQGIASATMVGGNIGKDLGNILDKKFTMAKYQAPQLPTVGQQFKTDGNGALLVSDVNMIDIADDYKELLSKRATERFNLQYKNVTPSVNIDHMDVHQEADADKIVAIIANGLDEVANSNLRGHYEYI